MIRTSLIPSLPNYTAVQDYLYRLGVASRQPKYGIERMALLAEALGQPQNRYPLIHVAGTNGKGSTCAMLEAIYRRAGYRTGLYTSPHLVCLGERIQVNRQPLEPKLLIAYTEEIKAVSERLAKRDPKDYPSFFEFMTGMAFLHFHREQVDIALIETGLGGRLDATNIVNPELAIVTSIGLDHTHLLGNSLDKIAVEKAGIIKPGKPVVCGNLPEEADTVMQTVARQRRAPIHRVVDAFGPNDMTYPASNLAGRYQRRNAATATLAVRLLQTQFRVPETKIDKALQAVDWPARWEAYPLEQGKTLILDTSHNPEGFVGLAENLAALVAQTGRKPIILAAALDENHTQALMPTLAAYADSLVLLQPQQPRACLPEVLQAAIPTGFSGQISQRTIADLFPRPGACTLGEPHATLVATGSIYLAGEMMAAVKGRVSMGTEYHLQDRP